MYEGADSCVISGELITVFEDEIRQIIFKELKKYIKKYDVTCKKAIKLCWKKNSTK